MTTASNKLFNTNNDILHDNNDHSPTPKRRPTVSYPVLHLDSFTTDFFPGTIPNQAGPSRFQPSQGAEDRQGSGDETGLREPVILDSSSLALKRPSSGSLGTKYQDQHQHRSMQQASSSTSSRLPPPPTLGLPSLPDLSPISPLYSLPPDNMEASGSASASTGQAAIAGPRPQGGRLGPVLSIHIPQSPPPNRVAPPLRDSPGIPRRRTIVEHQGHQGVALDVEGSGGFSKDTPRRLDNKASNNDLRDSPTTSSPTAKRSLPRPPEMIGQPAPSATWPIPSTSKTFTPQHQPQKSASILPIVSGLADAGPYPTTTPRQSGMGVGLGKPPSARAPLPKQEEVCLECLMRDRDLADVEVIGPGCWSRQSDADWDELKWREEALLKSIGTQSTLSVPSLEDAGSSDSESTSASFPSTGRSTEDVEMRRRLAAKKQQRMVVRAKRREADGRIASEVGWRGFKWEEGKQGEGMPRGFRGTVGGPLSTEAIKAVMTKYPKASEHRYEYLQNYLQHQWKLVLEIRADAARRGHFPTPGEEQYNDSISSHEPTAPGPRTSSISWEQRSARELREPVREPFVPASVRPSPSTPTELTGRPKVATVPRPHTQLLPESADRLTPTPHSARSRYEKGISSPGTLERSPQPDRWDDDDPLWSPVSAGDGGSLRPFSFAVRAGAAAGRDGEGNGARKSLWGRWGGSVTSFFGGSQGGSGSMMDMHLGLDNDRRAAYPHSSQVHRDVYPRAVSMASPSRPSFFSSNSRASVDQPRDPRALTKSISSSRLSQVVRQEDDGQGQGPKKKKGIKGLIQKMKPKSKRQSSGSMQSHPYPHPQSHHGQEHQPLQQQRGDTGTPLAPPPNMAYLSGDGQQRHHRNGSQSSMADSQSQNSNWKMRSVSAPIGGSSSGSLSASPTSSRFRRESYNSGQLRVGADQDPEQRGSIVEMLHASTGAPPNGQYQQRQLYVASPEPGHAGLYDDRRRSEANTAPSHANPAGSGSGSNAYPNPSFRTSRYTSGSVSNSSGIAPTIETPPMPMNATPFFSRPPSLNSPATHQFSPSVNSNSNRFKNLPPLPPQDVASSPESFHILNDTPQPDFAQRHLHQSQQQQQQRQYQGMYQQPPMSDNRSTPRASFDRPSNSPRVEASPRMVHSMYVQPSAQSSNPNFLGGGGGGGRYPTAGQGQMQSYGHTQGQGPLQGLGHPSRPTGHGNGNGNGSGFVETEKRGLMSKKGFKGLFGGAKAGRMA